MSRSCKKTPIHGVTTCRSEKPDKRRWHGRWRVRERQQLRAYVQGHELDDYITTHFRSVSNPWDMGKDGHVRWTLDDARRLEKEWAAHSVSGNSPPFDWLRNWKRCCLWK